jgi:sigma-70-like protein
MVEQQPCISCRSWFDSNSARKSLLPLAIVIPRTRGDCLPGGVNEARPCAHVTCRHHMQADGRRRKWGRAPTPIPEGSPTCSLDVADEGHHSLDEIAEILGLSKQRVEQLEVRATTLLRFRLGPDPRED